MQMLEKGKEKAKNQTDLPNIDLFTDYVTSQWFENSSITQQLWNIYDREEDDLINNCCETWHSKWKRRAGTPHPLIHKCKNLEKHIKNFGKFQKIFDKILKYKRFVGQLCDYALDIWKAEDALLPIIFEKKLKKILNDTTKVKKDLFTSGQITIDQYIGDILGM